MPNSLPSTERRAYLLLEDRVERFGQTLARTDAIDRRVLHAVGNPEIGDAGVAERFAHRGADAAASDAVLDPERADGRIAVRERDVVVGFGMREISRVEVEADAERFRPVDPAREVLRTDRVAVDCLAAEFAVERVEIEAMAARDQRQRQGRIGAQLIGGPGLARIVPRRCQAATEACPELLEPAYVIALPAMQRDGHGSQALERPFGIDAGFGVAVSGDGISALDPTGHQHSLPFNRRARFGEPGL